VRRGEKTFVPPAAKQLTVDEALRALETHFEAAKKKGLKQARAHMAGVRSAFGSAKAVAVTPELIDHLITRWRAQGVADATINRRTQLGLSGSVGARLRGSRCSGSALPRSAPLGRAQHGPRRCFAARGDGDQRSQDRVDVPAVQHRERVGPPRCGREDAAVPGHAPDGGQATKKIGFHILAGLLGLGMALGAYVLFAVAVAFLVTPLGWLVLLAYNSMRRPVRR
jgi:hypothetical protein